MNRFLLVAMEEFNAFAGQTTLHLYTREFVSAFFSYFVAFDFVLSKLVVNDDIKSLVMMIKSPIFVDFRTLPFWEVQ